MPCQLIPCETVIMWVRVTRIVVMYSGSCIAWKWNGGFLFNEKIQNISLCKTCYLNLNGPEIVNNFNCLSSFASGSLMTYDSNIM